MIDRMQNMTLRQMPLETSLSKDLGAFDPLGLARSGLMYVSGGPEPVLLHSGVMDQATAITASHAILTVLF